MSKLLYRLGHWSAHRRRIVLALWFALLVGVAVAGSAAGGTTTDQLTIPGTESQRAFDLLDERFASESGSTARIVFSAKDGTKLDQPAAAAEITTALKAINTQPGVLPSDPAQSLTVSQDSTVAFANIRYAEKAQDVPKDAVSRLETTARNASPNLDVTFGGDVIAHAEQGELPASELIGLAVAILVLLISFGSVLAMGLPLVTALIGVGVGITGITLMSAFVDLSSTAPTLATMIGLAVAIDYALFIVTRHRQNLAEGLEVEESIARANATAGGAVVFAGMTVVIALAALTVVGIPFLTVMGLAAAFTVFIAVAIAITLMPALLGFAGHNIDRFNVPGIKARTGGADESKNTFSSKFAHAVTRRPAMALGAGLGVMALLSIPLLSMRLGMTDAGTNPPSTSTRQAYDKLGEGFGPGFNGPLSIVVDLGDSTETDATITQISDAIAADPAVVAVGSPVVNDAGTTAIVSATPADSPAAADTSSLVHRLRDDVLPPVENATGSQVYVTGSTAANIDVSDKLSSALPVFMAVVIGLTMLLLMVVFRSILVPIKAAIAILLSIGASFGVLVAVFQWGWLQGLVGLQEGIPIVSFLPVMMFAILFGLSMDYEVFILSRIREDYSRTQDARGSVLTGLTSSARVITAAALIMISVFASFILGDNAVIKMFGLGLSVAVLLDATIVRMIIVPATMAIFDDRAWWLPRWLDRLLPNVDIEGEHLIADLESGLSIDDELALVTAEEPTPTV